MQDELERHLRAHDVRGPTSTLPARTAVVIEFGPDIAPRLTWGRCKLPTLLDVASIGILAEADGLQSLYQDAFRALRRQLDRARGEIGSPGPSVERG
jgi:hypothetical protein